MTTYLKFPDASAFEAAMSAAGLTYLDEDGTTQLSLCSHTYSIDPIGTIYDPPGEYSADPITGQLIETSPPVALDGYHVNITGNVPDELKEYIISPPPKTPHRVFF